MTTQHIYASSNLRRITYDATGATAPPPTSELDATGKIPVTMDLTRSYIQRINGLMKQLFEAKTDEAKSNVVARINVLRQELSYLTGIAFTTIQMTITTDVDEEDAAQQAPE
jgi:hypothetical protein